MKKVILYIIIVLLLVSVLLIIYYYNYNNVGSFHLNDYQEYIELFSSENVLGRGKELGEIKDFKAAKREAEKVWVEVYGKEILKNRPYMM